MLLSDLQTKPVTCDGERLGMVVDLRFAIDGKPSPLQAEARLLGVIVGPRRRVAFLGYERTSVTAPALLAHYFRRRQRGAFLVAVDDIEHIDESGVRVRRDFTRWSALLPDAVEA
jgi:hypothetical protein